MGSWLYEIGQRALEAVNQSSPPVLAALFVLTFLTEFAIPFPWIQDIIYFYVGFQFGRSTMREIPVLLALILGRFAGSTVIYWLARLAGTPFIKWLGRHFKSFPPRIAQLKRRLKKHTVVAMASVRLIPGALLPSNVAAGAVGLSYWAFLTGIFWASVIDDGSTILSGLLVRLSIDYLHVEPSPLVFGIGVVTTEVVIWLVPWIIFRLKEQKPTETNTKAQIQPDKDAKK